MIAVLGGLGAAVLFATATLSAARGSRLVGAESFLAGVMTVGLVIALPFVASGGAPAGLDARSFGWLALSGVGNVAGLLLDYAALRVGRLGCNRQVRQLPAHKRANPYFMVRKSVGMQQAHGQRLDSLVFQ